MELDVLAFGIHPDDVELSASGTLAKHKMLGYKVGICDLTRGELGSRGSGDIRLEEAANAAKILNLDVRENLYMEDVWALDNQENCLKIIQVIRKYRPKIVLANAPSDKHPDHAKGSEMIKKAFFLSGLSRIETAVNNEKQTHFRPNTLYYYIQFRYLNPDFVVNISDFMDLKMKSILAYSSQFYNPNSTEPQTDISQERFLEYVKSKDSVYGNNIGVKYGEGFIVDRYLGVENLFHLI